MVDWELIAVMSPMLLIPVIILRWCWLVPSVWRGDKETVSLPTGPGYKISVNARNYPTFVASVVCFFMIAPIWIILPEFGFVLPLLLEQFFGLVVLLAVFLMALTLIINAFNRPKFMIPPPHRDESGWLVKWWHE